MSLIHKYFPIVSTLRDYRPGLLQGDIIAGIIVAVMLIPQGMAYAVLAGLPPVYGLYASIMPLLVYALFGSSRELAVGPVAMVSLLVFAGVGQMADVGSPDYIRLALLTALGVGVVQFLMGVFKAGFLVNFFSHPVLSGFVSAAAIIIGLSQLGNLLGLSIDKSMALYELPGFLFSHFTDINIITAVVGVGAILLMVGLKKWHKRIPGALVAVAVSIVLTSAFGWHESGLAIVGEVPQGLPQFSIFSFNSSEVQSLLPVILTIALIGYMESMAVAKTIATKEGYKIKANNELIGLGLANIVGAFFQAYPTTGGLSRTAVNYQAGAKTVIASVFTVALIVLTVLFFTPLFYYLPMAILAAIVMLAVASLFDFKEMVHLWKTDRKDLVLLLLTFFITLFVGIKEGIIAGVILSLIVIIYKIAKPHSAELGRLGDTHIFRNIRRYPEAHRDENCLLVRFDAPLYFANVEAFNEAIHSRLEAREKPPKLLILDASAMNMIDSTGVAALQELMQYLTDNEIEFYMVGTIGPMRDKLNRAGLLDEDQEWLHFFDVHDAISYFEREACIDKNTSFSPRQHNFTP
jgi:SulP family sulfate permease